MHLSTTGSGSEGVRKFIMQSYALIKNDNPDFPFLIREAEGTGAKLTARYGALSGLFWLPVSTDGLPNGCGTGMQGLRAPRAVQITEPRRRWT